MSRSKSPQRAYVFANATVAVREPGSKYPTSVHVGSAWHSECPLVLANPSLFSSDPPVVFPRGWDPPVEQASAAPGEQRNTNRGD